MNEYLLVKLDEMSAGELTELIEHAESKRFNILFDADNSDELLERLRNIFTGDNFEIKVAVERDYKYDPDIEDDMFTKYASSLKSYQVHDGETCILEILLLKEGKYLLYYIPYASFYRYEGRKYGTKVVGAISNSTITNVLRISDRSAEIGSRETVWSHIVSKFPNLEYEEV